MQATMLVSMLLLLAAGCARSTETPAPAAAASANGAANGSAAATPAAPAQPAASGTSAQAAPTQGIRVGEPAPDDPRGPHRPAPGTAWHAFGNEPFWSVQAREGTLVFTTPDDQRGVTLLGRRVPSLVGTVILGKGPEGEFHFGVTPGKCSDGMSDRSYDYASTFIYAGTTYKGCAEPVVAR